MRRLGSWVASAGTGFVRACVVAAVFLPVPGVWVAAAALAYWWRGNPWSWAAPILLAGAGTLALSRLTAVTARSLVAAWTGIDIPAGYQVPAPVTLMSTGYWWNGFSYEKSRRDALLDQRWRTRWRDPAVGRDLRFTVIAPFTAGAAALLPPGGVVAAVAGLSRAEPAVRLAGAAGLVVAAASAPYAWRFLVPVAVRFLRPSMAMTLAERVQELTVQRADATVAEAAEIRRIERDLHDGAQARLVALGLSLATMERLMETDPARARSALQEARAGATASLAELRELVRGISPPVLSERGLVDAVRALSLDVPLDIEVTAALPQRLDPPVEAALYFGVSELLANAVKHAHAARARIRIAPDGPRLVVHVEDDGRGGVTVPEGGGVAGIRRRLAVFDGTLEIDSPAGGPTRVRMAVPCESS